MSSTIRMSLVPMRKLEKAELQGYSRMIGPTAALAQTRSAPISAMTAMGTRKSWAAVNTIPSKAGSRGVSITIHASSASRRAGFVMGCLSLQTIFPPAVTGPLSWNMPVAHACRSDGRGAQSRFGQEARAGQPAGTLVAVLPFCLIRKKGFTSWHGPCGRGISASHW